MNGARHRGVPRIVAFALTTAVTAAGLLFGTATAGATPLKFEDTAVSAPGIAAGPFIDVSKSHKFAREINWMHNAGLSTGVQTAAGRAYLPSDQLSREAMAAFMFRKYANKNYQAPARSWFNDVRPSDKFFREISWMYEYGLSTGVTNEYDGRLYQPKKKLSREAMAAFMYRALYQGEYVDFAYNLVDVNYGDKFSDEISWMFDTGLSRGVQTPAGTAYQPKGNLSREAMAAFMYRAQSMPADITRISNPTLPPTPKPRPTPKPPVAPPPVFDNTYYANCTAVWNAGVAPLYSGDPGYSFKLDRDRDGVACETDPR